MGVRLRMRLDDKGKSLCLGSWPKVSSHNVIGIFRVV